MCVCEQDELDPEEFPEGFVLEGAVPVATADAVAGPSTAPQQPEVEDADELVILEGPPAPAAATAAAAAGSCSADKGKRKRDDGAETAAGSGAVGDADPKRPRGGDTGDDAIVL